MRMRNSSSSRREMMPTEKEYEAAAILLSLPVLLAISSPTSRIASLLSSSIWGSKRKRSAIYDDKKAAVVNNKIQATTPRTIASTSRQSSTKPSNYACKLKMTKLELLKKVNTLTRCGDTLKREVERVSKYYDKLLINRSILNAVKHQLKKCDVEGKTKTVTGDGAAVFASQEDMSFMYPTAQSCQALPPKDNYPPGANSGLDMSCNGLAIGRAMDPSSRPHGYEFEGISGVGQVNKCRKEKKDD